MTQLQFCFEALILLVFYDCGEEDKRALGLRSTLAVGKEMGIDWLWAWTIADPNLLLQIRKCKKLKINLEI